MLRSCWQWRNYPPGHDGGGSRADAEVLLNAPGRQLLAGLCGVEEDALARALPSWGQQDAKLSAGKDGVPAAAWRTGGAVADPVAFGCRLCVARRTGTAVRVVRYAPRSERVCVRHGRWLLDADADQPLEHLDVQCVPEVAAAQRRWTGVARRAARAGVEPEQLFALDVATRSICAAVVRPVGTTSVDAAMLLAQMVVPAAMRPGWDAALSMQRSVIPYERLIALDARLEQAAARPVIMPETVVVDQGRVYISAGPHP